MPRTSFSPLKHGFKFENDFANPLVDLPGYGKVETKGRCGGMAFAALDYYFNNLQVPTNAALPADGTLLADYIYKRLFDSFLAPTAVNFVSWTLHADHQTWFYKGVTRWTREDEFPRLKASIDAGTPVAIGVKNVSDLTQIGSDHQIVGYGYEDDGAGNLTVYAYDNNYANEEVRLWTTPGNPHWTHSSSDGNVDFRGWFVEAYTSQIPDFLQDGTLLKEASRPEIYVVRGGGKFWIPSPQEFDAMGFQWGAVRTVADGSLPYVADLAADGTLLRERTPYEVYVMENGKLRWITSPEVFESMGFSWDRIRLVPDGSLASTAKGTPISAPPRTRVTIAPDPVWSNNNSGTFTTSDGDRIDFTVERGVVGSDVVEFVLALGPGITWKKVLNMPDGGGSSWDIVAEGAGGAASNSLWAGQVNNGQVLTFRKAKFLGFLADVYTLGNLQGLTPGSRATFHWMTD